MVKKIVHIGDLKQVIFDLENELGNVDNIPIWIQPAGTPPCEVEGITIIPVFTNENVLTLHIRGDIFK